MLIEERLRKVRMEMFYFMQRGRAEFLSSMRPLL